MTALPSADDLREMRGEPLLNLVRDGLIAVHGRMRLEEDRAFLGAAADIITAVIAIGQDESIRDTSKSQFSSAIRKERLEFCAKISGQARAAMVNEIAKAPTAEVDDATAAD